MGTTEEARVPESSMTAWFAAFSEAGLRPEEAEVFVHEIDAEILDAVPEVATDPALIEELHASTRAHWRNFLVALTDEYQLAVPPAAVALSQSIARRHLDINVLLKIYRVANRGVFGHLIEHTRADRLPAGLARDEVLIELWTRAARWIEDSVESLIDDFSAEVARLQEGAIARRAETIGALIGGVDPGADAERVLGHPLARWQTAFVLWASGSVQEELALSDTAVQLCQEWGLPHPLTTLAGSQEIWGWVATTEQPDVDPATVATAVSDRGLRIAIGRPGRGVAGFRTSHLQARAAQSLGMATDAPCQDYADLELLALVGDAELTREMVRREAGPLLGSGRSDQAVRATVLSHLRNGQDVEATARKHFVHPNTVRYRIGRAEEALGRRITARPAELEVALAWVAWYGPDALDRLRM